MTHPQIITAPANLIMIDLESLDTIATAKILQIGAVNVFKPHHEFLRTLRAVDQGYASESAATYSWWHKQDPEVRRGVFSGTELIKEALQDLAKWLPRGALVTAYGASFDIACLEYHYTKNMLQIPWHYRNVRCFRTILAQHMHLGVPQATPEHKHDALSDAHAQSETFRNLFAVKPEVSL